jgi:hypothetical protein
MRKTDHHILCRRRQSDIFTFYNNQSDQMRLVGQYANKIFKQDWMDHEKKGTTRQ